ncbi:MAG: ankyrin repeat domain-containing protein, partial [Deltaproteobacteria bacterium]|nr:ankyrin repeat domain-containing protein [Deltaproteobacteria bacterium]
MRNFLLALALSLASAFLVHVLRRPEGNLAREFAGWWATLCEWGEELLSMARDVWQEVPEVVLFCVVVITLLFVLRVGYSHRMRFHQLCRTGDSTVVRQEIASGADVLRRSFSGWTTLMFAAESNPDPQVLTMLIRAGVPVQAESKNGHNALLLAARCNPEPAIVRTLLSAGADPTGRSGSAGRTPLMVAAAFNPNPQVAKTLIDAGADLGATGLALVTGCHWTAVMWAAACNPNPEMIRLLLANGADLQERDNAGATLLAIAARYSRSKAVIAVLLDAGLDPELVDKAGETALIRAVRSNPRAEVIKALL